MEPSTESLGPLELGSSPDVDRVVTSSSVGTGSLTGGWDFDLVAWMEALEVGAAWTHGTFRVLIANSWARLGEQLMEDRN